MQARKFNSGSFKRELYDFLIKLDISLDTQIIDELIYKIIGIEVNMSTNRNAGFQLHQDDEKIRFKIPDITVDELKKLLQFFKIESKDVKIHSPLILDPDFCNNELLTKLAEFCKNSPEAEDIIIKYKIESKAILENNATTTIKENIKKALAIMIPTKKIAFSSFQQEVINCLLLLNTSVSNLQTFPTLYNTNVIQVSENIKNIALKDEVTSYSGLLGHLLLIAEGIRLYEKYNRIPSVLANNKLPENINGFLALYKITTSQCDIMEDMLLSLAHTHLGPHGKGKFYTGYDSSRLVFYFTDMDEMNAHRLVNYLKNLGDETAREGYGSRHHGQGIPEKVYYESGAACSQSFGNTDETVRIEEHTIETDGNFFFNKVLPLLKQKIEKLAMNNPTALKAYQDKSAAYFAEKEKKEAQKPSNDKVRLFSQVDKNVINTENQDSTKIVKLNK